MENTQALLDQRLPQRGRRFLFVVFVPGVGPNPNIVPRIVRATRFKRGIKLIEEGLVFDELALGCAVHWQVVLRDERKILWRTFLASIHEMKMFNCCPITLLGIAKEERVIKGHEDNEVEITIETELPQETRQPTEEVLETRALQDFGLTVGSRGDRPFRIPQAGKKLRFIISYDYYQAKGAAIRTGTEFERDVMIDSEEFWNFSDVQGRFVHRRFGRRGDRPRFWSSFPARGCELTAIFKDAGENLIAEALAERPYVHFQKPVFEVTVEAALDCCDGYPDFEYELSMLAENFAGDLIFSSRHEIETHLEESLKAIASTKKEFANAETRLQKIREYRTDPRIESKN